MKTLKWAAALAAMIALSGATRAADDVPEDTVPADEYTALGFYLRADAGWSFLDWNGGADDDALTVGGGFGYQFTENLRADLRVDWAGDYNVAPGADLGISTVMGNLYFDIPTSTIITPYVGAGLGWGWTHLSPGPDDDGIAWGLTAGAAVNLTEQFAIDTGYRLRSLDLDGPNTYEHQVTTGIRFKF
jgi:opacity protein-like surface antigen